MADLKTLAESRSALLNFDPRKLQIMPGLNGRDLSTPENVEHVEWLCASIMENGFLPSHPIEIFQDEGGVFVTSGHCRHAAVMMAIARGTDIRTVPCVPERRGTSEFERILHQSLDNSGKRLTPLEEGGNIKRALNLGATIKQIAKMLNKSETHVTNALDLQAAPIEVQEMVRQGEISATLATKVIRRQGKEGVAAIKAAVSGAKAKGKAKATEKHIEAAGEAAYNERRNPVDEMKITALGCDAWRVTIGRTDYVMSGDAWLHLCGRIQQAILPGLVGELAAVAPADTPEQQAIAREGGEANPDAMLADLQAMIYDDVATATITLDAGGEIESILRHEPTHVEAATDPEPIKPAITLAEEFGTITDEALGSLCNAPAAVNHDAPMPGRTESTLNPLSWMMGKGA